jgi:hypothetical protein
VVSTYQNDWMTGNSLIQMDVDLNSRSSGKRCRSSGDIVYWINNLRNFLRFAEMMGE